MINIGNSSIENILVGNTQVDRVYLGTDIVWEHQQPSVKDYLKFKALQSGTFTLTVPAAVTASHLASISYSLDNGATWVTTQNSSSVVTITTPTVAQGGTVLWKGSGNQTAIGNRNNQWSTFSSTSNFMCDGNIMSLLYGDDFEDKVVLEQANTFLRLFYQCTTITTPPKLPATTLKSSCYGDMFNGCTSLTTAPELPATTLASYCYSGMFVNCSSLTTAPAILPATTLYEFCYNYMFSGCSSLTIAPELPATILVSNCYKFMFNNCRALIRIKCLATDISASQCVDRWVQNVTSNAGTFVKNENMSSWTTGASGIPTNWTVVDYNS